MAAAFPEELSKEPSKVEMMRRGKVLKKGFIDDASIDEDERVLQALMYHRIWGWGKAVSHNTAGIGRTRFDSAFKDIESGGTGIVRRGPKEWLTSTIIDSIYAEITQLFMQYHSVRLQGDGEATIKGLINKHLKAAQHNTLLEIPKFSSSTWKTWMDRIGVIVRAGDKKAKARANTRCIRTPMAFASVLTSNFATETKV